MQPELETLLKKFDQTDNDCKDALLAWGTEINKEKKDLLLLIYKEKNVEREKIAKEMYRLSNI